MPQSHRVGLVPRSGLVLCLYYANNTLPVVMYIGTIRIHAWQRFFNMMTYYPTNKNPIDLLRQSWSNTLRARFGSVICYE